MQKRKILLVGWDAADWNVARPLMDAGKMPGLKSLVDQGVSGNLATIRPVLSPMLWTSISTGKRAWKHGIHGFVEPTPDAKSIRPITNLSRKTKSIWNILGQNGLKSNVIGWWPSHPAEPINGVMVSNHYQSSQKFNADDWPLKQDCIQPKRLETALKKLRLHPAELSNEHLLPFIPRLLDIDEKQDPRVSYCAKVIAEITSVQAAATACMQVQEWDFSAVYFDGIDHINHAFMKYHPPRQEWIDPKDFELYKNVVETSYCYHDMMLQVLLSLAGEDTTVMLISDHGFESGRHLPRKLPNQPAGPAQEHSPYGIFCLKGPGIRGAEEIHGASILDITPTLLQLFNFPVGRDMDGKALVNCFAEKQTVQYIDSWDEVEGDAGCHPPEMQLDTVESQEAIRQLVELGYIEEPSSDGQQAVDECIRELQINLVDAYIDGGRYTDGLQAAEKQWARWPDDSRVGLQVIRCYLFLNETTRARAAYEKLVQTKLNLAQAAQQELTQLKEKLAREHQQQASEAKAESLPFVPPGPTPKEQQRIRKLEGLISDDQINMRHLEATLLQLEEKPKQAIARLKQIEDLQVAHRPSLFNKLGELHQQLKQWDLAEKYYLKSLSTYPNSHNAHYGLANIYLEQKKYFEAAASAIASIKLIFHNPRAHFIYATALTHLDMLDLAEQTFLTAISQSPNYPAAHRRLAILYVKMGETEKAARHQAWAEKAKAQAEMIRTEPLSESKWLPRFPEICTQTNRLAAPSDDVLIIVSGLPRSGTSLMMQMLQAAGIKVVSDGKRTADESNPRGYFEDERIKQLTTTRNNKWLHKHKGQAVKIVAPLIPNLPQDLAARIVCMHRKPAEILASQRRMLEREQSGGAIIEDRALAKVYSKQLQAVNDMVAQNKNLEMLPVDYSEVIKQPEQIAQQVCAFLKLSVDSKKIAAVVDQSLYRNRDELK